MLKLKQGITLISLIITIVIIIILTGVFIALHFKYNIIEQAKLAKNEYINSQKNELHSLNELSSYINITTRGDTPSENQFAVVKGNANGVLNSLVKISDFPVGFTMDNCYCLGTKVTQFYSPSTAISLSHHSIYVYLQSDGIYLWITEQDLSTLDIEVLLMKLQ